MPPVGQGPSSVGIDSGGRSESGGAVDVVVAGAAVVGGVVGAGVTGELVAGGMLTLDVGGGAGSAVVAVGGAAVVAGACWVVVATAGVLGTDAAGVGTGAGPATVVDVVELVPTGSVAPPAVKKLPTSDDEVVLDTPPELSCGLVAFASGVWREESREVAATRSTPIARATPAAISPLTRAVLLWAYHHIRSRSRAGVRPNAVFLPMDGGKR